MIKVLKSSILILALGCIVLVNLSGCANWTEDDTSDAIVGVTAFTLLAGLVAILVHSDDDDEDDHRRYRDSYRSEHHRIHGDRHHSSRRGR